jgi:hypothetical protein
MAPHPSSHISNLWLLFVLFCFVFHLDFRPGIVIKRREEIVGRFNCLHMLKTQTTILPFPIFDHMDALGVPIFNATSNHCFGAPNENATSYRQEVCDLGMIPRCGDPNWQLNSCYDSFEIAFCI